MLKIIKIEDTYKYNRLKNNIKSFIFIFLSDNMCVCVIASGLTRL